VRYSMQSSEPKTFFGTTTNSRQLKVDARASMAV
jgi:hypothetical protein